MAVGFIQIKAIPICIVLIFLCNILLFFKVFNSSIKIITELLYTSNIEFLLSSKYLHTLYADKNNSSKNDFNKNGGNRMNYKISPNYELTPVFATGEIYLPSLGGILYKYL